MTTTNSNLSTSFGPNDGFQLWVNTAIGDDVNNNGSQSSPFKTIKRANTLLTAMAVTNSQHAAVNIAPGYYLEESDFTFLANVSYEGGPNDNDVILQKDDFTPVVFSPADIGDEMRTAIKNVTFLDGFTRTRLPGSVDLLLTQLYKCTILGPTTFTGDGSGFFSIDDIQFCNIFTSQLNVHSMQGGFNYCSIIRLNIDDVGVDGTAPSFVSLINTSHVRIDVTDFANVTLRNAPFMGNFSSFHLNSADCLVSIDEASNQQGTNVFAGGATAAQITKPPIGKTNNDELLNAANWTTAVPADSSEALNRLVADYVIFKGSSIT
jgi:hypothetical protein